ncbi:VWA domain-containing protein [Rhodopirellula sp. JC639]|uniref:VWA domain-containing protein n=1 Tax=Stieleria mannarensis TaxID=2755585 RepID=UPI0015FFF643|nr:VWA domain-containing protein [Rhodopirellula sp. JC639]
MTRFTLEPLYGSLWVALAAAAAVVAVIALVTPPTEDPAKRKWLIVLRSLAGLVLLIAAMRPTLVRTDNRPAAATLVVAVDTSRSMSLPDGDGTDRWASQKTALQRLFSEVGRLDEMLDIHLIGYDSKSESIAQAREQDAIARLADRLDSMQPLGDETNLGQAMQGAIDASAGKPMAGVVMMGDGTQTAVAGAERQAADQSTAARRGAEVLDALAVPLWTVPIGPPSTDASARDVALTNLPDSFQLFAGNQFEVSVTVQANGLARRQIPVTVSWIAADGTRTEARSRQIDPSGARETLALTIPMTAPDPGLYRLQVQAAAQEGEWVTSNNTQTAFVDVREGGGRILILEGPGRPEQTFLRRSLRRFPDLELDYAPIRGDRNWPVSLDAVLKPGRYDIFIIGDLDSNALGIAQLEELAARVNDGAGLITLGGLQTYGTGGYADGKLADVLPIKMDPSRRRPPTRGVMTPAERAARSDSQLPGPIKVQVARRHPIVDLGGSDPAAVWDSLPELRGANRLVDAKVAAGVQTLLETKGKEPLLVIGSYGKGRVASLAIDETYRWWRAGKAEAHQRFWRQLMLWLMSREESGGDRLIAEMDVRRFESDSRPEFRARLLSVGEVVADVTLSAVVVDEQGKETALDVTATAGGQPRISGQIPELEPGFYKLVVRPDGDDSIEPDEVAFQVTETSRELARPMADPVYMKQLADLTADHGGASFDPQQIDALIETIAAKRRSAETPVIEKNRLGDGPGSGWLVFTLFAGALSVEWFLRRRWGMV